MKNALRKWKKMPSLILLAVLATACHTDKSGEQRALAERDSLAQVNSELTEAIDFVNAIMDSISVQEQQLFIFNNDGKERVSEKELIKQRLEAFTFMLQEQKEKLHVMDSTLAVKGTEGERLKKLLAVVNGQLAQKDEKIAELRKELSESKRSVVQLREKVQTLNTENTNLQTNVAGQQEQIAAQEEDLAAQDKVLNECYYRVGTAKELRAAGLLTKGTLFKKGKADLGNIRQESFQSIDIREFTQLSIKGKKVKLLSPAPANSYTLSKSGDGYVLKITDATSFWSVSNYLLIQAD